MAGRKVFALFGVIGLEGAEGVFKNLNAIDKKAKELSRQLNKTGNQLNRLGKDLTKSFTLPLVAAGIAAKSFIKSASDLSETISKTNVVFGNSAKEILEWSKTTSKSIGQSSEQAMSAAANFAIFGKSAGKSGNDLVKFSTRLVELSSDLASFYNTSPEDAITAIGAALRGESEPIRRYGVLLDDATMRQKALELGIIGSIKTALNPQQKILAATELIFQRTTEAQGDYARTSDGLANKQRSLTASFKDVSAELGRSLLPVAIKFVDVIQRQVLPSIDRLARWINTLDAKTIEYAVKIAIATAAIGPLLIALGSMLKSLAAIRGMILLVNAALITNPIGAATVAIAALTVGIISLTSAYKDVNKEVEKNRKLMSQTVANKQEMLIVGTLEELIFNYQKLANMDKKIISDEEFIKAKTAIETLEKNIGDLGIEFTGSYKTRLEEATKKLEGYTKSTSEATEATKDLATATKKLSEEELAEISAYEDQQQSRIDSLVKTRMDKVRAQKEAELALEVDNNLERLQQYREYADEIKSIDEEINRARQQVADIDNAREEDLNRLKIGAANQLYSVLSQFNTNLEISKDNQYKKEKDRIENSLMSEEQKQDALKKIDAEYEKRKNAIRKRQAVLDKAATLFNIAINTASAIVEALPNVVLASFIGGLGAAQGIAVAAQPVPAAEKGAYLPGTSDGTIIRAGEKKKPEIIFPLTTGIDILAGSLIDKIKSFAVPSMSQAQIAGAGNIYVDVSVNGNFIGNNAAMRDLAKHIGVEIERGITRKGAKL